MGKRRWRGCWGGHEARRRTANARYAAYGCSCQGLTRFAVSRQSLPLLARTNGRLADSISLLPIRFLRLERLQLVNQDANHLFGG